jgi:hypothetical protein
MKWRRKVGAKQWNVIEMDEIIYNVEQYFRQSGGGGVKMLGLSKAGQWRMW